MKILLGMPCYSGMFPSVVFQSIFNLKKPCPMGFMTVDRLPIDRARNIIAAEALRQNYDYLLFIDDDNPIPRDTLIKFLEDDKDVVCAPILRRKPDEDGSYPLCALYGHLEKDIRIYEPITEFREQGYLHRIDACGMGCTLIKRKVLEAVNAKYPDRPFQQGNLISFNEGDKVIDRSKGLKRTMSEDLEFCERAVDAGFEVWLDDRIRPLHLTGFNVVQWKPNVNTAIVRYKGLDKEFIVNEHPFWKIVENGQWELPVIEKLIEIVKPTDTIFDVGAWIGVYTLLLSHLAKTVVAFEPCQKSREMLVSNLLANDINNVIVEPFALSDQESSGKLYRYNPNGIDEVLGASMMNMIDRGHQGESIPVLATTIDIYCEEHNIKPDGIKVDVEGYESKVLAGCSQECWKLIELHGQFAERPNIEGEFIDGDWNYGHLFVPA